MAAGARSKDGDGADPTGSAHERLKIVASRHPEVLLHNHSFRVMHPALFGADLDLVFPESHDLCVHEHGPGQMNVMGFLIGGIVGVCSALAVVLLTDAGWRMGVAVYFSAGFGVPVLIFCLGRVRCVFSTLRRDRSQGTGGRSR